MAFTELLASSNFSFLRGASHPEELVTRAQELGLTALALCDRDGLYGMARAYAQSRASGQRLIVGAELTLNPWGLNERPLLAKLFDQKQPKLTEGIGAAGEPGMRAARLAAPGHSRAALTPSSLPTVYCLVENHRGYSNLCHLLSSGHRDMPKGKSLVEVEWLAESAHGLRIVLPTPEYTAYQERRAVLARSSSSRSDEASQVFLAHGLSSPQLSLLAEVFGAIGAQDGLGASGEGCRAAIAYTKRFDGLDDRRAAMVAYAQERYGLRAIASNRPLYHISERKYLADVLLCVNQGLTLDRAGRALLSNAEACLRSEAYMRRLFAEEQALVDEAAAFAEPLVFEMGELNYKFPCRLQSDETADQCLGRLVWQGAAERYPGALPEKVRRQLQAELSLIQELQVAAYFLSTWEVVQLAKRRQILCQGRGSAANSAVCYVLGITAVDPARSELLFERFLSRERNEPPDIDVDFEHERREEIIQDIYQEYGRDRAAMVSEVICYRGKSALREVSKAFGLSLAQADRLSSSITHWDTAELCEKRLKQYGFDPRDPRLIWVMRLARQLEGFPRHLSIHVGGFVLSAESLEAIAPIEPARMDGRTVIPWDKDDLDILGFFKIDVLALGMLTAVRKCLELVHKQRSREPFEPIEALAQIPPEQPEVYEMISRADTVGVFQIESRAQMTMLPRLRPSCYYDLVIEVALVRPGPIQGGMVHPYLRRRNGLEPLTYPHENLAHILRRTLGVPLFQEQVMQIAIEGAGYSGGDADQLRRDMASWGKTGRLLQHRERLLAGFMRSGIEQRFGEALFEQIKGFGEYGFPESHAASFALIVYASAWLKRHYLAEFTCALINSQPMGFYSPGSLVRDAQAHGVKVLDVCVLRSGWDCSLEELGSAEEDEEGLGLAGEGLKGEGPACAQGLRAKEQLGVEERGAPRSRAGDSRRQLSVSPTTPKREHKLRMGLRLGLRLVKGASEATIGRLVEQRRARPFESIRDLARRVKLERHELTALAEAGALERLLSCRRSALWEIYAENNGPLFSELDGEGLPVALPRLSGSEQLVLDYERKGLSVSDHPMRYYRGRLAKRGVVRAEQLINLPRGKSVQVAGLVLSRQRPMTAHGITFITLEDETGVINLIVYAEVFERFHLVARHSVLLLAEGKLEIQTDEQLMRAKGGARGARVMAPAQELPAASGGEAGVASGEEAAANTRFGVPVIHVLAARLERLDRAGGLAIRARDFH